MKKSLTVAITIAFCALLFAGCGTLKPSEYKADFFACITGNGSYDSSGNEVVLESVTEGEDGWKQFVFSIKYNSALEDIYIVAPKQGVTVDDISVVSIKGDLDKEMLTADFENRGFSGTSGWKNDNEKIHGGGTALTALKPAAGILYFVKDGKKQKTAAKYSAPSGCDGYRLCVWILCDWNSDDYDNVLYVGVNKVK